jgi:GT2 family glycosyltransferase
MILGRAVPVVIPTCGKEWQVRRCLDALAQQTVAVEPILVDDGKRELGFTMAVNTGLRRALDPADASPPRYAVVLNQDCYLAPAAIERCIDLMEARPRVGIVGPKQLAFDDPDRVIHAGCTRAYPTGRHIGGRKSRGDGARSAPMPWVNGACFVVRTAAVREFGLLDDRFVNFGSDSDWCYSARVHGWEVWYCAEAECLHETGVSTAPDEAMIAIIREDMTRWGEKWLSSPLYEALSSTPAALDEWTRLRAEAFGWAHTAPGTPTG